MSLGSFDLVIGSDVLYDRVDPSSLVQFIDRHASGTATVVIVDLGRRRLDRFTAAMAEFGFACAERSVVTAPRPLLAEYRRL